MTILALDSIRGISIQDPILKASLQDKVVLAVGRLLPMGYKKNALRKSNVVVREMLNQKNEILTVIYKEV